MTPAVPMLRLSLVGDARTTQLGAACAAVPQLKLVHHHEDPEQALREVPRLAPDVVLLAPAELPRALDLGHQLREHLPHLGIVVVAPPPVTEVLEALAGQALPGWACMLETTCADATTLERAIVGAASGLIVLDPDLCRTLPVPPPLAPHRDLLALLVQGYSQAAIAHHLGLTEAAIVERLAALYGQLGLVAESGVHPRVRLVQHLLSGR